MMIKVIFFAAIVMAAFSISGFSANLYQPSSTDGSSGHLELECNMSNVDLYVCPKNNFSRQTVSSFFGLIKTQKDVCSGDRLFLGTTPFKPVGVPAGKFVLLIPPRYTAENEAPIEILIQPGQKSFLMLKLFRKAGRQEISGPADGGPGDAAGIGAAGSSGGSGASGGSSGGSTGGSTGGGSSGGGSSGSGSAGAVGAGAPQ